MFQKDVQLQEQFVNEWEIKLSSKQVVGNPISANLRHFIFKIFWGSMPPSRTKFRPTASRRSEIFLSFWNHLKFDLDPRVTVDNTTVG